MGRMQLVVLLDRLERTIESSANIPLTGKIVLEKEEVLDLVEQIRQCMPEDIERASRVVKDREDILKEARREAQEVVKKASEYVDKSITESDIVKEARAEANKIVDETNKYVTQMREGADKYAEASLANLEDILLAALKEIRHGREILKGKDSKSTE